MNDYESACCGSMVNGTDFEFHVGGLNPAPAAQILPCCGEYVLMYHANFAQILIPSFREMKSGKGGDLERTMEDSQNFTILHACRRTYPTHTQSTYQMHNDTRLCITTAPHSRIYMMMALW